MLIRNITVEDIDYSANISVDAYSKEPWNEKHDLDEVKEFLTKFTSNNIYTGWVVVEEDQIIGFAVGVIIPCTRTDYFRIEDICIRSDMQGKGLGREFIKRIALKLKSKNIDFIMLNTVKTFPAYKFYLANEFTEIESSATMILEI